MNVHRFRFMGVLTLIVVLGLACGGNGPPPEPPTETKVVSGGEVVDLEGVKSATIQIEAQGSFIDAAEGATQSAGRGSGFIIDSTGIAVTNHHVVTGAALLKVRIGEESESRNAKILGVSECSDLAIIQIEGNGGYPYLGWYDGTISTGLTVYTAGFPLGDPQYTLTDGIITKERANGDTSWASVDAVIEHNAIINHGSSGGPLVTKDGKVVAVNYASNPDVNQYFAIAHGGALKIIEVLRNGQDVDSIGVNGQAFVTEFEIEDRKMQLSGIWVASVKSGSPADKAGIKGGDIITHIEGLILAKDGTMADYCDILRSHRPEDTLSIQVMRFKNENILWKGQLNGRVLAPVPSGTPTSPPSPYMTVTDNSRSIQVDIPREWDQINGESWGSERVLGATVSASSNLQRYNSYSAPGVFFGASKVLLEAYRDDLPGLINTFSTDYINNCTFDERKPYERSPYVGIIDIYRNCGGTSTTAVVLAAVPSDGSFIILLTVQAVNDADLEALNHVLDNFEVVGDLPQ